MPSLFPFASTPSKDNWELGASQGKSQDYSNMDMRPNWLCNPPLWGRCKSDIKTSLNSVLVQGWLPPITLLLIKFSLCSIMSFHVIVVSF